MKTLAYGMVIWICTVLTGSVLVAAIQSEFRFGQALELAMYFSGAYGFASLVVFMVFYILYIDNNRIQIATRKRVCVFLVPLFVLVGFVFLSRGDLIGCFSETLFVQAFISYCAMGMINMGFWNHRYFTFNSTPKTIDESIP